MLLACVNQLFTSSEYKAYKEFSFSGESSDPYTCIYYKQARLLLIIYSIASNYCNQICYLFLRHVKRF